MLFIVPPVMRRFSTLRAPGTFVGVGSLVCSDIVVLVRGVAEINLEVARRCVLDLILKIQIYEISL